MRSFASNLRVALTPSPDYWSWITRDGVAYEDVDVLFVRANRVTFRHRDGTACVPISMLSDIDRKHLAQEYEDNGSVTLLPVPEPTDVVTVRSEAA